MREDYEDKKIADVVSTIKWAQSLGDLSTHSEVKRYLRTAVDMGDFGPDIAWKIEMKIVEDHKI